MDDLKTIKKLYGEKMMHICRELFPVMLETPGKLIDILLNSFEPSKYLYDDLVKQGKIVDFKDYIYKIFDSEREEKKEESEDTKTPSELLSEAGYILYECKTEEEIQSFRKYYYRRSPTPIYKGGKPEPYKGEELCTFNGGRLNRCHVFFAVKKDVDKIKREDFTNPDRQDLYGTSVISIQFSKDSHNTLSIKNRYNHTVPRCDSTFSNNLDNIIPGLTESFRKYYNLNFENQEKNFELDGYVRAGDGKLYKYNYEINNIYYCPDNIIIDNFNVIRDYQQMERYIVLDYFIIDLKEKKIELYDKNIKDSFIDDLVNIEKIDVEKDKETSNKEIKITIEGKEPIIIKIDKENNIIGYENNNLVEVGDNFLRYNYSLKNISLSKVETIGDNFLWDNGVLESITLPNVEMIGDSFISSNNILKEVTLPKAKKIGHDFLYWNRELENIELSNVETIGDSFLPWNETLENISIPKVKIIGDSFLCDNRRLKKISILSIIKIGDFFLNENNKLQEITMPNLEIIGDSFLSWNQSVKNITMPKVKEIGINFFGTNSRIKNTLFYKTTIKDAMRKAKFKKEIIKVKKLSRNLTSKINEKIKKFIDKVNRIIR